MLLPLSSFLDEWETLSDGQAKKVTHQAGGGDSLVSCCEGGGLDVLIGGGVGVRCH